MLRPVALTVAGSDSGGGAGIQADLKTFEAHGVFGTCAVVAITAQDTRGVHGVWPLPLEAVAAQLRVVLEDFPVGAIKVGMLATAELVEVVARGLDGVKVPVVLDPVLVSTSGHRLLTDDGVRAVRELLVPRATLVTPNRLEHEVLGALAGVAVLAKGGHGTDAGVVTDILHQPGKPPLTWTFPRLDTRNTHGTGCSLSSAVTARLARGEGLEQAVEGAVAWIHRVLEASVGLELGSGPQGPLWHQGGDG